MSKSGSQDEIEKLGSDLAQVARLAVERKEEDLRMLLARLARRYRREIPSLSAELAEVLSADSPEPTRGRDRKVAFGDAEEMDAIPALRFVETAGDFLPPVLGGAVGLQIRQIVEEWRHSSELLSRGLEPVSSVIFTGPPGVGKSYTARWLASELNLPLFVLDLTAVMSSRLGQTGANLRAALDYARRSPAVLFLDEVDSIAKRRSDEADVGELKRLVTIMLQELDDWPSTSLLVAATNHAELVDRALWRRFDLHIDFPMPDKQGVSDAIERYLGSDALAVAAYRPALERLLQGSSFSDIQKVMNRLRKQLVLGDGGVAESLDSIVQSVLESLTRTERIEIADDLQKHSSMSQHQISRMMGVSRDTLRKRIRATEGIDHG